MFSLRRNLLIAFFAVIAFFAFIPIMTYSYYSSDLSDPEKLISFNDRGIVLLDVKDQPFFKFYQGRVKSSVLISEIPLHTRHAVIAVEDKDFYFHPGFSIKAMARSLVNNLYENQISYGASTITQQVVKNSLLSSKKSFLRKYQEVVLATEVEKRYTKDQILQMYLTTVYFGNGAFGIGEAAQIYFQKPSRNLNLSESAMLVGLLPAPSYLSNNINQARQKQKIVLQKMYEQGYIERAEMDKALKEKVKLNAKDDDLNDLAPHFALMIRDELIGMFGEEQIAASGYQIKTTLNLDWQKYAEGVVSSQVNKLSINHATNGAAVVIDPKSGEIRAMVGSKDWSNERFGKVNIALAGRQPGSSFKPLVYVTAFEKGLINPATILDDKPTSFLNDKNAPKTNPNAYYKPVNYDSKFRGKVTVRRALSNSLNVPSVEVMSKVGVENVLDMAKRLGITTLKGVDNYGLSLVLGTGDVQLLELTNVYATLANEGYRNDPVTILEIIDKEGNTIYKYNKKPQKVLDEKDVFQITSILSDNNTRQEVFGHALNVSRPAAVKTGTTNDYRDAWTLGYTPDLAIGVWVGNNNNAPMDQVAGSLGAAPIWKALIEKFSAGTSVVTFEPPSGLIPMVVCRNGGVAEATPGAKVEYFIEGSEPKKKCRQEATPSAQQIVYEYYYYE